MHYSRILTTLMLLPACTYAAEELDGYEYVVVGSGAGGGPLAARLALAGHKTLLIEAGGDQGDNFNYTVPAFSALASEDDRLAWNFFVRHYEDDKRQAQDYKATYETSDGKEYTGLNPPPGSKIKGTLYPRANTLGGCTSHNALIAIYPHMSDFDDIANLTGDNSWSASNMRKYFQRLEKNDYLKPNAPGHGYSGWLDVEQAPINLAFQDTQLLNLLLGGAAASGGDLGVLLTGDANNDTKKRDVDGGYFQIPISSRGGARNGPREFIVAVRDAKNPDGSKKYPLDVRTSCHVTKVIIDKEQLPPRAVGVEFLDGAYLYRASPRAKNAGEGKRGTVRASREVIVAGGTYNSPQILKLSGIGPADELKKFNIPLVADLPGVGTNLQDHYETAVQANTPANFTTLEGCTFGFYGAPDPCRDRWEKNVGGDRGPYASAGFGAAMLYKTSVSPDYDAFIFGGPVNFRGYFPGYSINITDHHDAWTWAILKAHPRNNAGHITLQSADPLDVPNIVFNYFDTGSGDYGHDLQAISEAIAMARNALSQAKNTATKEVLPGPDVTSKEAINQYILDTAWGHHASCTCPIGPDGDKMAVLDSSFRVRGVKGLRVVDASVYPRIPGTFTAVSTYLVSEKAADVILGQLE
ncbi:hypothetical protein QQS21_003254 [Conoideocrella luteorostrata]|uniref:Glucose-methanol-choline oxidoreductase N-terminal domain-containing protein n=1 Tax=Conoideocrella luteorostrata TaxID=1105319 RepID=A0AAJ0CUI2_9HYPO|nr:hypothetical protein QQS21_003254 [Conoideocrella luteorostrata]